MTDTTPPTVTPAASTPLAGTAAATGTARATGRTVIADTVISKLAGIAARAVPGVHAVSYTHLTLPTTDAC
ncbi:Asp23/Gls24 family envelope stress response protein [Frigoribacterium faeni]|uniref:Asp23/Gls24 family envelope stress response protein n=1 Tax=Frigoribacterium faeni TaxID=145483 RepID=UPI001FAD97BE|nr:Asp23/Gls24 family envelope stress response protein [Frigoribacterium faeni]MCJ0702431.1 Asp23/Gls24 family envelope stress response protein [Frigoribacterium faeni]